jgi:hypothetical protein
MGGNQNIEKQITKGRNIEKIIIEGPVDSHLDGHIITEVIMT